MSPAVQRALRSRVVGIAPREARTRSQHLVMSDLHQLLAAVIAAPTDPAPRRAYAHAVRATAPERAELIDLQLAIRDAYRAHTVPPSDMTARARSIAHNRGTAWAASLANLVFDFTYLGGFVEWIKVSPAELTRSAATLARQAPIRHVALRQLHGHVPEIVNLPFLAQIVSLDVSWNQLTNDEIAELVASPHLNDLAMLRLDSNPIGLDALRAISRAKLPKLRYVGMMETHAPLVDRTDDDGGSSASPRFTRPHETLVAEVGPQPWLTTTDEPELDVL
jgi:hypothetical protein